MPIKESRKVSRVRRFREVIKNGMLLFGVKNRLARIGITIMPYYWVQEEFETCAEPQIKGDVSEFKVRELNLDELMLVSKGIENLHLDVLEKQYNECLLCLGLEHNNQIAAYMIIGVKDLHFRGRLFPINNNEAYLSSMWTFHDFRGRNLAPYLRYKSYQVLKEQGRDIKYSISEYFNKSTLKFKNKLNSKPLQLFIYFDLFGKWKRNYLLKSYTD
ncbi:hypothetical protein [Arenibacter certesii]|uniref:N-acetyltransferase domain-containing protein n=1 Tax=Arenibacter certesii TaxID=228955 RepID=A0A918MJP9_9FLAO|nr:hypothetical protein [Arenibacter certesii]GGW27871.1 hypothetical protein GCM10007383_11690 [Arenibacter certesii]